MANSAFLTVSLDALDAQNRPIGIAPLTAGWSPDDSYGSERLTLAAEDDTLVPVPDGTKCLLLDVGEAINLFLKSATADDGIPVCATTLALRIPILLPLGDDPVIYLFNGEDSDQEIRCWYF